jgi:chemotaxis protein CheX
MSLQSAPTNLRLPAILDLRAAAPLAEEFLRLRGQPVTLDASQVERLGGLCLQVLLSARAAWTADRLRLDVAGRSAAFDEALALFSAPSFDA